MACPPEDSRGCEGMGNRSYQEFLGEKSCACKRKYKKLCAEVFAALTTRASELLIFVGPTCQEHSIHCS